MNRPINLSSTLTIFLKIFFPIFWLMFFGLALMAFLFSKESYVGGMPILWFRLLMFSFVLTGALVMYFSIMRLQRVEIDKEFFYITNYKKTARYPFHNIEKIEETSYFLFKVFHLYFREPGIFGKKLIFLASGNRLNQALHQVPELNAMIRKEK